LGEEKEKNNIIIFGLQERGDESYMETLDMVVKFLGDKMGVEISKENTDYLTRLGRRRGERPILIKFTTFFKKLEVWRNKKNLAGTKSRVDEDLSMEDRKMRELIPYLKDAKKWGHKAFLKKHALMVNGRTSELNYLKENIQLEDAITEPDSPGNLQATILQQRGSAATRGEVNGQRRGESTPAVWSRRGSAGQANATQAESTEQRPSPPQDLSAVAIGDGETRQEGGQQYNLRSWLTKDADKSNKKRENSKARSESA
jgi:hypothetical protein